MKKSELHLSRSAAIATALTIFLLIVTVFMFTYLIDVTTPVTIAIRMAINVVVLVMCGGLVMTLLLGTVVRVIYGGWVGYFNKAKERREDVLYANVYALLCDVTDFDDLSVQILNKDHAVLTIDYTTSDERSHTSMAALLETRLFPMGWVCPRPVDVDATHRQGSITLERTGVSRRAARASNTSSIDGRRPVNDNSIKR